MSTVGQFSYFDMNHWLRVKAERIRLGIIQATPDNHLLMEHPLIGRTLLDPVTERQYYVESIKKKWWMGWLLLAKLRRDDVQLEVVVENISSTSEDALRSHRTFQEMFATSLSQATAA